MIEMSSNEWSELISDDRALGIIHYLEEYNPNVTFEALSKDLDISGKDLGSFLGRLIKSDVIAVQDNGTYKLTDYGKFIAKRLSELR